MKFKDLQNVDSAKHIGKFEKQQYFGCFTTAKMDHRTVDTGKKTFDYWKTKIKVHPYSPHWKKKLKKLGKIKNLRICIFHLFAAEISYLYTELQLEFVCQDQ